MKVLVAGTKGGVGKTTITMGLASVAHFKRGGRVAVVDADQQGSAGYNLKHVDEIDNFRVSVRDLPAVAAEEDGNYSHVFLDVPPRHEHVAEYVAAAKEADFTLLPFDLGHTSIDSMMLLMRQLKAAGVENWSAVLNNSNPQILARGRERRLIEGLRGAGIPVMDSVIRRRSVWGHLNVGTSRCLIHQSNDGSALHEIESLFAEIEAKISAEVKEVSYVAE